jgi:hypothetical protein
MTAIVAPKGISSSQAAEKERYAVKMAALVVVIRQSWLSEYGQIPQMKFCRVVEVWRDFRGPEFEQLCWLAKGLCEVVRWGKDDTRPAAYQQHQFVAVMRRKQCIAAYQARIKATIPAAAAFLKLESTSGSDAVVAFCCCTTLQKPPEVGSQSAWPEYNKWQGYRYDHLQLAIVAGKLDRVRALIDLGVNLNASQDRRLEAGPDRLPIRLALALKGEQEPMGRTMASELIQAGADVNVGIYDAHGSLFAYVLGRQERTDLIQQILKAGFRVNTGFRGFTALMQTVHYPKSEETIRQLLRYGAKIDLADWEGKTALHYALAAMRNHGNDLAYEGNIRFLLERGASTNVADKEGNTALHSALSFGNSVAVVNLLLQHKADVTLRNQRGRTPLDEGQSRASARLQQVEAVEAHIKKTSPG